jgi:preprotein translocase subunit SecA
LGAGFDYIVDEKAHTATLTDAGIGKCERSLGVRSLYDDISGEWVHHITQAIRAHMLYKKDVDYVVKDGEVIIVDEFTGRLMPGRRWSDGLHQAVEAKEGMRVAEENQTFATITFQNFFQAVQKARGHDRHGHDGGQGVLGNLQAGCGGHPAQPLRHAGGPRRTASTGPNGKNTNAIIDEIEDCWRRGQPFWSAPGPSRNPNGSPRMLRRMGVPHNVLNAKYHEQEAQIIAQAGRKAAVTIATNMAGRGTDIILGGNPPDDPRPPNGSRRGRCFSGWGISTFSSLKK